jgi:hypothetical protein
LPTGYLYRIESTVTISSYFPIFIQSAMNEGVAGSGTFPTKGCIIPGAHITSNALFRWDRPAGEVNPFRNGGGGLIRVAIIDIANRFYEIDSAVYVRDAVYFEFQECYIGFIPGSAIRLGNVVVGHIKGGRVFSCGSTGHPTIHARGESDTEEDNWAFAGLYMSDNVVMEGNGDGAAVVQIEQKSGGNLDQPYFEANHHVICVHAFGGVSVKRASFATNAIGSPPNVVLEATSHTSIVEHCWFNNGGHTYIMVKGAQRVKISHNTLIGNFTGDPPQPVQTGSAIELLTNSYFATIESNELYYAGNIDTSAALYSRILGNALLYSTSTEAYLIKGNDGGMVANNTILQGASGVGGILGAGGTWGTKIDGNHVLGLNNGHGIKQTSWIDMCTNNYSYAHGSGLPIDYATGGVAHGNFIGALAVSSTGSISSSTATANAERVVITTPDLNTLAEGATHTLTLTNKLILDTSQVNVHVARDSCTSGYATIIQNNPSSGVVEIVFLNGPGTGQGTYNGKMNVHVEVKNN